MDISPPQAFDRQTKRHFAILVLNYWNTLLMATQVPAGNRAYERVKNVQPGDYVAEISTLGRLVLRDQDFKDDRWDGQFVKFLRHDFEYYKSDDEGFIPRINKIPSLVCLNPDGTEFVWTNAELIQVHIYDHYSKEVSWT